MSQLASVFKLDKKGFNLRRGVSLLVVMLAVLIVTHALDKERYFLSVAFGVLFAGLSHPGGEYAHRVPRIAVVGVIGAGLTALGFGIGDRGWGWVVLAGPRFSTGEPARDPLVQLIPPGREGTGL